jgi:glycosyltransferase involved in cell wall biosynthesis
MRIGVYNQFWPTAGGGEKFAGGIAQVLAADHRVELVGHEPVDLDALGERLQLDLSRTSLRIVAHSPTGVEGASSAYDLFVNASYGSVDRSAARRGLYIVHFPVMPPFRPGRARRALISATARAAARAPGPELVTVWRRGVYAPERVGPATYRWTDGDAELCLRGLRAGDPVVIVLGRLVAPGARGLTAEAIIGGHLADRVTLTPRRGPLARPFQLLRFRAPEHAPDGLVVRLRSDTHVPGEGAGDRRVLGVPVLAVAAGPRVTQLLRAAHQWASVGDIDLDFLADYEIVANSVFSAGWVRRLWGRDAAVLNPPVSRQPRGDKASVILNVGRFFPPGAGHSKRQLDLVGAFRELVAGSSVARGWELHLAGGCDGQGTAYLDAVRAAGVGLPVHLHANASTEVLRDLYARASIYWHATGLGEDVDLHPDRFEHFGISTAEAMSAGAVPVVIGAAGQLEVLDDGVEGYHFTSLAGLVERTRGLIEAPARRQQMSIAAERRAHRYGWDAFAAAVHALVTR